MAALSSIPPHQPVLLNEVVELFQPERGGILVDGTLGFGGHSEALLRANPSLQLIVIDQDAQALEYSKHRLGTTPRYIHGNFSNLRNLLKEEGFAHVDGVLLDIGVSSYQIDTPERGFSFMSDGPLDMRMDQSRGETAGDLLNRLPERELADIFYRYGEERLSRRIAQWIVEHRQKQPWERTGELAELIIRAYPSAQRHRKPHPATRVFQALRIAVNSELFALEEGMDAALSLLAPAGILGIITFHSLEDRMVKQRFRNAGEGWKILTKRPITASLEELARNPRARSAKLRAIERLPTLG